MLKLKQCKLGKPLSQEEILHNKKQIHLWAGIVLISVLIPVFLKFQQAPALLINSIISGQILLLMIIYLIKELTAASTSIIDNGVCSSLLAWAEIYPEVKNHIQSINKLERPIYMDDWLFIRNFVKDKHRNENRTTEKENRVKLHSI